MAKKKSPQKKSILEGTWQDISIYLYLWRNPDSTFDEIGQALGLKYSTINGLVNRRVKQGFIVRTRVRPIVMGEDKFTFSLSDITIAFLKKLQKEFSSEKVQF